MSAERTQKRYKRSGELGAAFFAMYAVRPINEIYHLVTRGGQDTLCGLRVSRIASDRTGNRLQLVHDVPSGRAMCKHCERIRNQDVEE